MIALPAQCGFFLIDKPAGLTSHDVVNRMRRILRIKRVGHAGTLDPLATGLLVIAAGPATRLLQFLSGMDKDYYATLELGAVSDSYDAAGRIEIMAQAVMPSREEVEQALAEFIGEIEQVPPVHSALKIGGERAYEKARRGEMVEMKSRKVSIERIELVEFNAPILKIYCTVSSGTYIRSLAHDVGQRLGCGAYLSALRRTRVGHFAVANAALPEEEAIENAASFLTSAQALSHLTQRLVNEEQATRLRHGMALRENEFPDKQIERGTVVLINGAGEVVAIAQRQAEKDAIAPMVVLPA